MSESRDRLIERMRTEAQHLRNEEVLLFPFPTIDAALLEHLTRMSQQDQAPSFQRSRRSEGSTRYALQMGSGKAARDIADIDLRSVAPDQTHIAVSLRPLPPTATDMHRAYFDGWSRLQLFAFLSWFWADQKRMRALAANSPTPENTAIPVDEYGNARLELGIRPASLPIPTNDQGTATLVPPLPDPDIHSWDATLAWKEQYGKDAGIITDSDLSRRIMKSPKTIRNRRSDLGLSPRPRRKKNNGT